MDNFIQVITTTEDGEEARKIARALVEKRLAACVQTIGPVMSTYWWEDNIVEEQEYICLIKSREDLYQQLELAVREEHSYETPEIIAFNVLAGSEGYLKWMKKELKPEEEPS